ncbi:hypothetical protein RhiirB3_454416 [Rhizophagus irregularis]|nr:hypothetical protein RhiirB3_454416 [Rhizophagus irregularis]
MVRHDVDSILAQRTRSVSDESDESVQHSVANNSEASSQSESSHASSYSGKCSDWNLINFLKFRQMEDNWSADKQKEHGTYTKTLGKIAGSESSEYRSMAVSALKIFPVK